MLENCRGLVFDKDYNIISLPFTKVYNYGIEKNAPVVSKDQKVVAFKKLNGFLVACTAYNGKVLVSTTGSLDSDFCKLAQSLLTPQIEKEVLANPNYTYLYEGLDASDPHIIKEEIQGLACIGRRKKEFGSNVEFDQSYLHPAIWSSKLETTVENLVYLTKKVKHEGFVFYFDNGKGQQSAKIKSTYYLATKFLARVKKLNFDKLNKFNVDEEFFGLIAHIKQNSDRFMALSEKDRISFVENYFS